MLPGRASQARNRRSNWLTVLTATILSLLVLCVVMPFIIWQYSSLPQSPAAATERQALTPLQQLQQQRSSQSLQESSSLGSDSPSDAMESQQLQPRVSTAVLVTADQVSAAQKYLHSIQHPTKRQAVPASRYIIEPEPYDMRQQHKQVGKELGCCTRGALRGSQFLSITRGRQGSPGVTALLCTGVCVLWPLHHIYVGVPASAHYSLCCTPCCRSQVKSFLGTAAFASQQAARKANGGRGIIINAGGPHLLSSAIVTIKVIQAVTYVRLCDCVLLAGQYIDACNSYCAEAPVCSTCNARHRALWQYMLHTRC